MKLISNFLEMPTALRVISTLSLLTPFLMLGTMLTGGLGVLGEDSAGGYRFSVSYVELSLVFMSSFPISLCGFLMLNRKSKVQHWYIVTWIVLIASPIFMETTRQNMDFFIKDLLIGVLVGVAISLYLVFGKDAKLYFRSEPI